MMGVWYRIKYLVIAHLVDYITSKNSQSILLSTLREIQTVNSEDLEDLDEDSLARLYDSWYGKKFVTKVYSLAEEFVLYKTDRTAITQTICYRGCNMEALFCYIEQPNIYIYIVQQNLHSLRTKVILTKFSWILVISKKYKS